MTYLDSLMDSIHRLLTFGLAIAFVVLVIDFGGRW